jgi:DnaJ family protein C protein 7
MGDTIIDISMESTESARGTFRSEKQTLAELKKESGNQLYKIKKYHEAIAFYTDAIELCPDSSAYYGNRSACYMMLNQYELALVDARKAVALDRSFAKGYIRIAKCSLVLGEVTEANTAFSAARKLGLTNSAILPDVQKLNAIIAFHAEGKKAYLAQDYTKTIFCVDRILEYVPCTRFKLQKAGCLALLGRFQEAQNIANGILHIDEQNAEAFHIRGWCLYYQGNIKEAFSQFKNALRLALNHGEAMNYYKKTKAFIQKMEEGNKAFNEGRFSKAYSTYTEALKIDPKNNPMKTKLLFNRAMVCQRLRRLTEAVADCTSALDVNKDYPKALLVRAQCYMDLRDFDKAVRDYKTAFEMDGSPETMRYLEDAELALKKSKHKDYYRILGVERNASPGEIKRAYRKKALVHHPDRHVNASEAERSDEEKNFKEVGEAFATLSSPERRASYDSKCAEEAIEDTGSTFDWNSAHQALFTNQGTSQFRYYSQFTFRFQ